LRARAENYSSFIFGVHQTKTLEVITEGWRRKLNKLWKICGPHPLRTDSQTGLHLD